MVKSKKNKEAEKKNSTKENKKTNLLKSNYYILIKLGLDKQLNTTDAYKPIFSSVSGLFTPINIKSVSILSYLYSFY